MDFNKPITFNRVANRLHMMQHAMLRLGQKDFFTDLDYPKHKLQVCNGIRFYSCMKEPETVRWLETFNKTDVVYDIGACVGAYSLIASIYAKEVYAFEPAFFNYNILLKNITYNWLKGNIENNIIPIYNALGDKTTMGSFNYASLEEGSALHALDSKIDYKGDTFKPVYCQKTLSLSLDDFVRIYEAPIPNHIKLDVDGNEIEILQGADAVLKSSELKSILVEMDGEKSMSIIALLAKYGFKIAETTTRSEYVSNYVFRR